MHADGAFASLPAQDADTGLSASLLSGEIYAFLLLGEDNELVPRYRRRLAAALN